MTKVNKKSSLNFFSEITNHYIKVQGHQDKNIIKSREHMYLQSLLAKALVFSFAIPIPVYLNIFPGSMFAQCFMLMNISTCIFIFDLELIQGNNNVK